MTTLAQLGIANAIGSSIDTLDVAVRLQTLMQSWFSNTQVQVTIFDDFAPVYVITIVIKFNAYGVAVVGVITLNGAEEFSWEVVPIGDYDTIGGF